MNEHFFVVTKYKNITHDYVRTLLEGKAKCKLGELSELEEIKSRWIWLEIIESYRESLETIESHSNSP
jgi:hypothetical protein